MGADGWGGGGDDKGGGPVVAGDGGAALVVVEADVLVEEAGGAAGYGLGQRGSTFRLFACRFQPGLISQPTVFFSRNKPTLAGLISPETNQRTGRPFVTVVPPMALSPPYMLMRQPLGSVWNFGFIGLVWIQTNLAGY